MLAKINRITENREFLKIFKTVRPYHTEHIAFRVANRNNSKQPFRAGFVVSNKIDKRSSRRNGLKRRIRAVFEQKNADIKPGIDIVIQVKKQFDYPYNYQQIESEVLEGLQKIEII